MQQVFLDKIAAFARQAINLSIHRAHSHILSAIFCVLFLLVSPQAFGSVIISDTVWSGDISLTEDVLVPEGVKLTILPGTTIRVTPSESTKTDPEYLSSLTEITVRGTLLVNGKQAMPVSFFPVGNKQSSWAGIIVDRGKAVINSAVISNAETGVYVGHGSLSLTGSVLRENRYGLTVQGPDSTVSIKASRIQENDYGVFLLSGAKIDSRGGSIKRNRKKDAFSSSVKAGDSPERDYAAGPGQKEKSRVYGDDALLGTAVWQGRIEVNGIVRVPENSRLIILPGTIVEFKKKDTNKDNIGENGLFIQGMIVAKGTKENPIIFRSGEKQKRMGDWDSINIMNSDKAQNLIEHCRIEDAYRGLHFHFSYVAVADSVLKNNYRGIQFQESVVEISGTRFYGNKSAFQARDSEIMFTNNVLSGNYTGMNIFRNSITLKGNVIVNNEQEGVRIREGLSLVEANLLDGNRNGIMVSDAAYGSFHQNIIAHNQESGMSLKGTDTIDISGNAVQANGVNGINIQDSNALIRNNLISGNRERGIGAQSFHGTIAGNNIVKNGLYNLGVEGAADVAAPGNWWGGQDVRKTISDKETDASKGRAELLPMLENPAVFSWPLNTVPRDTVWHGDIAVSARLAVEPGTTLVVSPATRVLFEKGAGLSVKGKILARGDKNAPITFASSKEDVSGAWDEILLDHAVGSEFANCIFRNATWALHSHFTDLKVEQCVFKDNGGGLRFTSGPIEVRNSNFRNNDIGIRAFRGVAQIAGNIMTANGTGIFVREKGGGLTIRNNNIFANRDYNLRLGDFNDEDVDARNNWWGDGVPGPTIYDARSEPDIGMVRYEPYARKRFPLGDEGK